MKKLWEIKHPYYCSESNYFSNDTGAEYESWSYFLEEDGDSDEELNLLFRWDWQVCCDEDEKPTGEHLLLFFWIGQRKGLFRCTQTRVKKSDEPEIRKWLKKRSKAILKLWENLE